MVCPVAPPMTVDKLRRARVRSVDPRPTGIEPPSQSIPTERSRVQISRTPPLYPRPRLYQAARPDVQNRLLPQGRGRQIELKHLGRRMAFVPFASADDLLAHLIETAE